MKKELGVGIVQVHSVKSAGQFGYVMNVSEFVYGIDLRREGVDLCSCHDTDSS